MHLPVKQMNHDIRCPYTATQMNKTTCVSICLMLLLCATSDVIECSEITLKRNVSYSSVTELGFTSADQKLVYGDDNPDLQYGLLWLPPSMAGSEKAPLIVFIHGGCWLNQYDIQHSFPLGSALAKAGYGVWSLEYRRSGDAGGGWPGSLDDIRQGLAFTAKLENYPLDLDHIVIMGHSAGGHLALLAASGNKSVDGVIGLAAITDIVTYSRGTNDCQTAAIDFMGGAYETKADAYAAANPASGSVHDHTILLNGDMDSIVPPEQAQLSGATAILSQGAGHFDWIHPQTAAYQLLLSTLDDLFQK